MSDRTGHIVRCLEQLVIGNEAFDALERTVGVFCPFEAIGMVSQEIRHGRFLAYCIDPRRPHGFGSECLRALIRAGASQVRRLDLDVGITPIDTHLMSLDAAETRREWRGVDLVSVIADEKLVVAVELKIDATEHSGQLRRYREAVQKAWPAPEWRHLFLFLTKRGDEPSRGDGESWIPVPLDVFVAELGPLVDKHLGSPDASNLLRSYISMLRRNHVSDQKLEEIARKLWSAHGEALAFLMDHQPDNSQTLIDELTSRKADIARCMSEASGLPVVGDVSSGRHLRFSVDGWDEIPDLCTGNGWSGSNRMVLIELEAGNNRFLGIRLVVGPGDEQPRKRVSEALRANQITSKKSTDRWTRFSSTTLYAPDDPRLSVGSHSDEEYVDRALDSISEWAGNNIPRIDAALRSLRDERPAPAA